ncbi:MAG: DNA-directed RNA polymerase subunit K [Thermoproteota archaeon]
MKQINIGPPILTRFERARIIGNRALQLSFGAPPLIQLDKSKKETPIEIAERELESMILPVSIRRKLPDGRWQDIPVSWLI